MKNSQMLKITGLVLAVIGAVLSLVGGHKLSVANGMVRALATSPTGSSAKSLLIWETNRNTAIAIVVVGIVFVAAGIAVAYNGLLKANEAANPETSSTSTKASDTMTQSPNTSSRLKELDALKSSGLISEDEYQIKRQKIIDEI